MLSQYLERKFSEQSAELRDYVDKKITKAIDNQNAVIKRHMEVLVEHVRDEVGGAYKDELIDIKERLTRVEEHVGLARE